MDTSVENSALRFGHGHFGDDKMNRFVIHKLVDALGIYQQIGKPQ